MRIEYHVKKAERFQATIRKLDYGDDYETIIEDLILASAHLINAALHKKHAVKEDLDIKHNKLFGFLKNGAPLGTDSERIAVLMEQLEQFRPGYVYGKAENGETARKVKEIFSEIKKFCDKILQNYEEKKNERES